MDRKLIIIRKSYLPDFFGASIFQLCQNYLIAATDNLTEPDEKIVNDISGRDIFIVGNYYSDYLEKLSYHSRNMEIFLNHFDEGELNEGELNEGELNEGELNEGNIRYYRAEKQRGFATFAVKTNSEKLEEIEEGSSSFLLKIAELLDEYMYGFPTTESIDFYNGVITLSNTITDIEKLSAVTNKVVTMDYVLKRGSETRDYNSPIIRSREESAKDSRICDKYTIRVCLGKDTILETCFSLAKKHGIGFLMHYDKDKKGTNIFCGVTEESGFDSRQVLKDYIGNSSGTIALSSGFMPGLCELYKLFC